MGKGDYAVIVVGIIMVIGLLITLHISQQIERSEWNEWNNKVLFFCQEQGYNGASIPRPLTYYDFNCYKANDTHVTERRDVCPYRIKAQYKPIPRFCD